MYRGGKKSNRGRGGGRNGDRSGVTHYAPAATNKTDTDDMPMVKPGKHGNYSAWIKNISKEATRRFGKFARNYMDDAYYVLPMLELNGLDLNEAWQPNNLTVMEHMERQML